jgi:N6-L-threonylcarbamoyladenine synthase
MPDSGGVGNAAAVAFPFMALVVSGGHCLLLRVRGVGAFEVVGGTLDNALGEAYDKAARLLNLPVGGGGGPAVGILCLYVS